MLYWRSVTNEKKSINPITGRFGGIVNVPPNEGEQVIERISEVVSKHVKTLSMDGRDFSIRTYRTKADNEHAGQMFSDQHRYKTVLWVALENYNDARIGEHAFSPSPEQHIQVEWFSLPATCIDLEGNEQPGTPRFAKIKDIWFKKDFIMGRNRQTYLRIEPPEELMAKAKINK